MSSNQIAVSDFLTSDEEKKENTTGSAMKIPSFLNCTLTAKANKVLYDNLTLKGRFRKINYKRSKSNIRKRNNFPIWRNYCI